MSRITHTVLIDDNRTTNFLHKYLLLKSKRFKHIETFINGKEVLDKFSTDPSFEPDVIFLDLNMPYIDGWQVLKEFEKLYAKRVKTKIFILTSANNSEYTTRFRRTHTTLEYLIKPLNLAVIEALYHKYFSDRGHLMFQ